MAILLDFRNVYLFREEPFGVENISFTIERHRKYKIILKSAEQLNTLAGLLEGKYQKQGGHIDRKPDLFVQSDRKLLEENPFDKTPRRKLAMQSEFFNFGGRQRTKFGFIQRLKAKHLLDYPIHKLTGKDRVKYALLAMTFQESGLILISQLLMEPISQQEKEHLFEIIEKSNATVCLITSSENQLELDKLAEHDLITFDWSGNKKN